jgi:hypothetical protein
MNHTPPACTQTSVPPRMRRHKSRPRAEEQLILLSAGNGGLQADRLGTVNRPGFSGGQIMASNIPGAVHRELSWGAGTVDAMPSPGATNLTSRSAISLAPLLLALLLAARDWMRSLQ